MYNSALFAQHCRWYFILCYTSTRIKYEKNKWGNQKIKSIKKNDVWVGNDDKWAWRVWISKWIAYSNLTVVAFERKCKNLSCLHLNERITWRKLNNLRYKIKCWKPPLWPAICHCRNFFNFKTSLIFRDNNRTISFRIIFLNLSAATVETSVPKHPEDLRVENCWLYSVQLRGLNPNFYNPIKLARDQAQLGRFQ